jgi:hypothetical protein
MADISTIIELTKLEEGGLSRAQTDNARFNPSPYEYDGKKGWHTNRGVTYAAFKSLSKKLGYTDNRDNFINMPDDIWLKIAKIGYWDIINLDAMQSQAIANLFFSWQWGAGYNWRNRIKRYLATKKIVWDKDKLKELPILINDLVKKEGEKKILDELIEQLKEFYISLNQPANTKGWLNRTERLKQHAYKLLTDSAAAITNPSSIVPLLIVGVIFYALYFSKKLQS